MKKKLITLLALVAIVSSFAMAVQVVPGSPTYSEDVYAITTVSSGSTVVADAESIPFTYLLEAENGTTWVSAQGVEVYDADWNVRDASFSVDFRIRATAGTDNDASPVTATVTVGKLTHTTLSSTKIDKDVEISEATVGSSFTLTDGAGATAATGTPNAVSAIKFSTISGLYYGGSTLTDAKKAADSVNFTITYTGDSEAPAGRYKSTVTVAYVAS